MSEELSRKELLEQKRSEWKQHIEKWRSSGMTQTAYCHQHQLKDHQFSYWKKRFIQTDSGITFVPVNTQHSLRSKATANSSTMRLIVDGGLTIEIQPDFDPKFLCRLVTTLRSLP